MPEPQWISDNVKGIGVVDFAPMFRGHCATGYYADLVRMIPDVPNGTSDLIIATALQDFIREGSHTLSLGLAPFAKLSRCANEPPFIHKLLSFLYVAGNQQYHFKGNYFHKEKYRAEEIPVFHTTANRTAMMQILKIFKLTGVF